MNIPSRFVVAALMGAVVVAVLAACSANGSMSVQPSLSYPNLARLDQSRRASVAPDVNKFRHVIYTNVAGLSVFAYGDGLAHRQLEKLQWQRNFKVFPLGIAVDTRSNLYVGANGGYVEIFPPGAKQASSLLQIYSTAVPVTVAVSHDGYVAATLNSKGSTPSSVMIWAPGSTTPCANVTTPSFGVSSFYGSSFDSKDGLYVIAITPSGLTNIGVVRGLCKAKTIGSSGLNVPGALYLQVDTSDNIALSVKSYPSNVIDVFTPGSKNPIHVIKFSGVSPTWFAFESSGSKVWITPGIAGGATEFNYPSGGNALSKIPPPYASALVQFISVAPASSP